MIDFLKNILSRKPRFHVQPEHAVELAFECGGIKYFQHQDPFNTPYRRGFTALAFYEELRMRTTREYLLQHVEAVNAIVSNPKSISIKDLVILNEQLKQRLNFIIEPDILYKLASVVFFDETENPAAYDFKYGLKKIENWKKHSTMNDFFLLQPLVRLIPYLMDCEVDIESYSKVVQRASQQHLDVLSSILYNKESTSASAKNSLSHAGSLSN
jgi:hypothetical protein